MELPLSAGFLALRTAAAPQACLCCVLMALCWASCALPPPVLIAVQVAGRVIAQFGAISTEKDGLWTALRAVEVCFHLRYRLPRALSRGAAVAVALLVAIAPQKQGEMALAWDLMEALVDALLLASLVHFTPYSGIRLGIVALFIFSATAASSHLQTLEMLLVSHQKLLFYWLFLLGTALPIIFLLRNHLRKTIIRKFFHFLALGIFLPALSEPEFLSVAFICALDLFILVEFLRKLRSFSWISAYMESFMDSRDSGEVALTHICLLAGCGLPVLMEPGLGLPGLRHLGLLVLCIGDSAAAIVGSTLGRHWLPYRKPKTWEGLAAGLGAMLVYSSLYQQYPTLMQISLWAAVYEAYTQEIDNLSLPVFSMAVYSFLYSN